MKILKTNKHKTKFVAYAATSIDGKISIDNKKMPDWTSKEDWDFFQKSLMKFDAFIVGHNTYLTSEKYISKRNAFVLTSKVKMPIVDGSVTFVNPKYINLKTIFSKYKKVAIVGGGYAYETMRNLDMLDELFLTIEPIIFGRGLELFHDGKKNTKMKLLSVKKLNIKGTILLHYKNES